MSKKNRKWRTKPKPRTGQWIVVAVIIGVVIVGGLAVSQSSNSGGGTTLRDTDTSFSVPTHVGQPASQFTAVGVDGQPYTVMPGDGRPKAIVFYMGYQ
ncbi:MAG: hypothetical protein ACRDGG_04755 [Anaerolineae bacterium]